jgi:cob(I)alamin adenosyltransferase
MADKHRISKVTTRAGDTGKTKLATGRTVNKHSTIMLAMGGVDELNSQLGLLLGHVDIEVAELKQIQQNLFDMGAVFAMEGEYAAPTVARLEQAIERLNAELPPLTEFVLPGGGLAAAQSHVCRSVCRRAERDVWALISQTTDSAESFTACARYLNRLSDYLFVLARTLTNSAEEQWQKT